MASDAPPSGVEFFVDRSLGRHTVPSALRAAGRTTHVHDDHFAPDAEDVDWLPVVAARGWVVITKDRAIGRKQNELAALRAVGARVFALTAAQLKAEDAGALLVAALPKIDRILEETPAPFFARVTRSGVSAKRLDSSG